MEEKERREALERQLKDYPEALDPTQVAEVLNCTRRYVDKLIDAGKLPAFALDPTKERQEKRVTKADLMAYMLKNQIN
jgi:excisionase family DNA binding protein